MKTNSMSRIVLALVLAISLIATGCSAQWISVALADLPVLTQMALNLTDLAATLQTGKQLSPAESLAIQNVAGEASKDPTLLQSLCNEYKANPSRDILQKIESLIQETSQNLPALLQAAHIGDPALSARITAAVNLILSTVNSFAALLPRASSSSVSVSARVAMSRAAGTNAVVPPAGVPRPQDLKKQWNQQVCGLSGNAGLDAALSERTLR
jgi:hypothetical protein